MSTTLIERARGLFFRERPESTAKPAKSVLKAPAAKAPTTFHAVTILPGRSCCQQARALQGQRFMSREAPSLPLKNCSRETCTCRYQHHDDRRAGPRRARDMGVAMDGWLESDRRDDQGRSRRKIDRR